MSTVGIALGVGAASLVAGAVGAHVITHRLAEGTPDKPGHALGTFSIGVGAASAAVALGVAVAMKAAGPPTSLAGILTAFTLSYGGTGAIVGAISGSLTGFADSFKH